MTLLVIGIDPGESTGLAALLDGRLFDVAQGPPDQMLMRLQYLIDHANQHELELDIAVERYTMVPGSTRHTAQPAAIGLIETIKRISPVPVSIQQPSDARQIAPASRLRQLGLSVRPHDVGCPDADDATSAMRHAVLLLARRHARLFGEMLARGTARMQVVRPD